MRTKDQMRRRGERLVRLAYDLEAMSADASKDGMDNTAATLRDAMKACRIAGDAYEDYAAKREN